MKKIIFSFALILLIIASSITAAAAGDGSEFNILIIGGKSSRDCSYYLKNLMTANGVGGDVYNLFSDNSKIADHWRNTVNDNNYYDVYKNNVKQSGKKSVRSITETVDFDAVVFERTSGMFGEKDLFFPYASYFEQYIAEKCPNAELFLNSGWAYPMEYTGAIFSYYSNDTKTMSAKITSAANYFIDNMDNCKLINTNLAVEYMRDSGQFSSTSLMFDATVPSSANPSHIFYRPNNKTKLVLAGKYYKAITGKSPSDASLNSVSGVSFTDSELATVSKAVNFAGEKIPIKDGSSITFTYEGTTLKFSGKGSINLNLTDANYTTRPWDEYKDKATDLVIGEGITLIAGRSFRDFSALKSITLPNSLTKISAWAFKDIGTGNGVVTSVNIPSGTAVDANSFNRTSKNEIRLFFAERTGSAALSSNPFGTGTLVRATLVYEGSNEEFIKSIKDVTLTTMANKTTVLYDPSTDTLTIGKKGDMADLTEEALSGMPWAGYADRCVNLVIEDGATFVGKRCFKYFTKLSNVTLPEGITGIGAEAFENSKVTLWNLPSTLVYTTNKNHLEGIRISGDRTYVIYPGSDDISGLFKIAADNADVHIYTPAGSALYGKAIADCTPTYHVLTDGINNIGGKYAAVYNTGASDAEGYIIDAQYTEGKGSLVSASVKPIGVPAGLVRCVKLSGREKDTIVRSIFCFKDNMITPEYNNVNFN